MNIIDGRKIKDEILEEVKEEVLSLTFTPVFCDILVGNDPVSSLYVRIKSKAAEFVGIKFRAVEFTSSTTTEELIEEIENLNKVPHMCGIIVQLPLPEHIDRDRVLDAVAPELDVDCLNHENSENFYNNKATIVYPTALACMKILDLIPIDLSQKNTVVLGRGRLVGRPVTHILKSQGFQVEVINRQTENVEEILKKADVIISAIGQGRFLVGGMIKKDVIIIDAGTSEENGAVVGDVDFESTKEMASYLTPSPGGVGPVTVAMLLKNVLEVAKNKK